MIQSCLGEQVKPLFHGVQQLQSVVFGVEHNPWMWMKTEQGCCCVVMVRYLPQLLQHSAVAGVHAIESPDGEHRAFLVGRIAWEFGSM